MASQVTINVRADVSEAQASIQNAIAELRGLAQAANEGSTIAQNAFRNEANEIKAFAQSLGASKQQMDQLNSTTQQFEDRVASMDRTMGRAAQSGARSFSILATQTALSTRSVDQLIGSMANLGLGMTGAAGFVAAAGIAIFGLVRYMEEAAQKSEKLREDMDRLTFDNSFVRANQKYNDLTFQMQELQKRIGETKTDIANQQREQQAAAGTEAGAYGTSGAGAAAAQTVVNGLQKELNDIIAQRVALVPTLTALGIHEGETQGLILQVAKERKDTEEKISAAKKFQRDLDREQLANEKAIAKFAQDLAPDMHFANEQPTDAIAGGPNEAAPGSRTRPIRVSAPKIDAMQELIKVNGQVGASFVVMAQKADDAFGKTNKWVGIVTSSLSQGFQSAIDAIVSGKGTLKQVEQAIAAPWIKGLEARAEYDLAMAASYWMNPPVAAKYLESAALDIAGAAAISRILEMGSSSSSSSHGGSSGSPGGGGSQLGAGTNAQYQQPIIKIVVTGDLTMDGRTVANLNSKLQRVNDRGAPIRAVL